MDYYRGPGILSRAARRGGTASVELALVMPVLIVLLFGSIEVGMLVKASITVSRISNEAARMAGIGAAPARIDAHTASSATGLDPDLLSAVYERRSWDVDTQAWGEWTTLGTDPLNPADNDASMGEQVRVVLDYPYALLFRGLFGAAMRADGDGALHLPATVVTARGFGEYREQ